METRDRAIWHYTPPLPLRPAPFLQLPWRPLPILRHIVASWRPLGTRSFMLGVSIGLWHWTAPSLATAEVFAGGWIAGILLRNFLLILVVAGGLHLLLQRYRLQGDELRYDSRPMARKRLFLFGDQVRDNMFLSLVPAVVIGTLWESLGWWAYANEVAPIRTFDENPIWFIALIVLVPVWSIVYFSIGHWLLHRGPVYAHVHSWHHKNVNVGPWSGLAMHPAEHVLLYGDVLLFLVLPSHPIHLLFAMMHHTLGAPMSHTGYDAVKLPGRLRFELGDFFHQIHHRFIECNYGGPESPLDELIGAWHDGSPDGDAMVAARRRRLSAARRGLPVGDT